MTDATTTTTTTTTTTNNAPARALNFRGFAQPRSQTRVLAAMSGGDESSVVGAMLKRDDVHRTAHANRYQYYFLFATTRAQLDFLRFPLGGMPKPKVRALAEEFGLKVAAKPDSQDICFVPNGKYQSIVEKLRPGAIEPGE